MFEAIVKQRLEELGVSAIRLAIDNGLPRDAIRSVLRGHPPSIERARDIASALNLEFYIGSPRDSKNLNKNKFNSENPIHSDGRLAEMMSLLATEFEASDARHQAHLVTRFHAYFPELGGKPTNRRCHE